MVLPDEEAEALKQTTNFRKDDLKRWYKKFMKDHPDGKLHRTKFNEIFTKVYPSQHLSDHIFNKLDRNQDGHVSFRELMVTLSVTMHGSNRDKLEWAFDVYDVDGNGQITFDEMLHVLRCMQDYGMDGDSSDRDSDEKLSVKVEEIFRIVDTDGNGSLSREEFIEGMNLYPSFWQMLKVSPSLKKTEQQDEGRAKGKCMRRQSEHGRDKWRCKLTCSHHHHQ